MWEHKWGRKVPEGCIIHHLDWDKGHNEVENLICLSVDEHERVHNVIGGDAGRELGYEMIKNRVDGIPPEVYNKDMI